MNGGPVLVKHKQDWSPGFILLLIQAAVLRGSGANSNEFQPASGLVIKKRQTTCAPCGS